MTGKETIPGELPGHAATLFADGFPDWETREGRWRLIEVLLEDGDHRDIRWLLNRVGEPEIIEWLERRGGRRLSRRSCLFWGWLLGRPVPEAHPMTEQIWPL